jgi:L-lactate dehydrogenase complex protein LldG
MDDLLATFECNAKEAAAEVFIVKDTPSAVRRAIEDLTHDAESIVLGLGEFVSARLVEELREIPSALGDPSDEQLSEAHVGVTDAFAAIASTGSVCVAMGPPFTATASLLMPLHIVILSAERIVARPRDLFDPGCLGGGGLQRNLVFITGPSATADMGPLVRGVHGPHRLAILVTR